MSGNRLPSCYQEVIRISQAMMLLPEQQKNLLEAYAKSVYGEKNYESFGKIKSIVEGMIDLRIKNANELLEAQTVHKLSVMHSGEGAAFYGKLQVEDALIQLLCLAAGKMSKEKGKVKMVIQPNQESLIKSILRVSCRLNIELEHIICLDCNREDNDNISLLFSVFAFEFSNMEYQSYFYYDNIDHHVNQMSLLPNMILAGEYVFLCSKDVDQCLIIQDKVEVNFFRREYEKIKKNTSKLGIASQGQADLLGLRAFLPEQGCADLYLGFFPSLALGMEEKVLNAHLLAEAEQKKQMVQEAKSMFFQMADTRKFRSFFSEKGLRRFLETGLFPEYPEKICLPLTPVERKDVVNRVIQLMKAEYVQFYMAIEENIRLDPAIAIYANGEGIVSFLGRNGDSGKNIMVKEASIGDSVHRFADFALENDWFYGKEETLQRMEQIAMKMLK